MPFIFLSRSNKGFYRNNYCCRPALAMAIFRSRKGKTVSVILICLITAMVLVPVLRSSTVVMGQFSTIAGSWDNLNGTSSHLRNYRPWPIDSLCKDILIEFIPNCNQSPIPLVSYPGSGNTCTRGIIERLTGFFTGSLYEDQHLYSSGE